MHRNNPPRVAAIHDLSCFGRCALSVITPVLSVMGAQVIPIPTALLSTHTGGFDGLYFHDLSADMPQIIAHFERLGLSFDAIYSGFLGSAEQISIVSDFIDRFGEGIPVLVDPVMGDDGSLYQTYTDELVDGMRCLCKKADIITPNLTEACFLTGIALPSDVFCGEREALDFAARLCRAMTASSGKKKIVITGIHYAGMVGNACFEPDGGLCMVGTPRLERSFPGTGEVFTSVLLGGILRGADFCAAVRRSADYTYGVIAASQDAASPTRDGVLLENHLAELGMNI